MKYFIILVLCISVIACKKKNSTINEAAHPASTTNTNTLSSAASMLVGVWIWDSVVNLNGGNVFQTYTHTNPQGAITASNAPITYDSYTLVLTNVAYKGAGNGSGILGNYGEVNINEKITFQGDTLTSTNTASWQVSTNPENTYLILFPIANPTYLPYSLIQLYPAVNRTRIRTLTSSRLITSVDLNNTVSSGAVYYFHR